MHSSSCSDWSSSFCLRKSHIAEAVFYSKYAGEGTIEMIWMEIVAMVSLFYCNDCCGGYSFLFVDTVERRLWDCFELELRSAKEVKRFGKSLQYWWGRQTDILSQTSQTVQTIHISIHNVNDSLLLKCLCVLHDFIAFELLILMKHMKEYCMCPLSLLSRVSIRQRASWRVRDCLLG